MDLKSGLRALFAVVLGVMHLGSVRAGDGVDVSYIGGGANELNISTNLGNNVVVFGPGNHGAFPPPYYRVVPNGAGAYDLGVLSQFNLTHVFSGMTSAYYDRVGSATFYYRIYEQSNPDLPPFSTISLAMTGLLDPNACLLTRQNDFWESALSIDVLNGLHSGAYFLEFYIEAVLLDYGRELGCSNLDPVDLCDFGVTHSRILSSRFTTTDPGNCDYGQYLDDQSAPTRIAFSYSSTSTDEQADRAAMCIQPNPVHARAVITLPEPALVYVFGAGGRPLYASPEPAGVVRLETATWAPGVYLVVATLPSGAYLDRRVMLVGH
jgi:hypothetical protein